MIDFDIWMKLAQSGYGCDYVPRSLVATQAVSRPRMTLDISPRAEAIDSYYRKWQPIFEEWLGEKRGRQYCEERYIRAFIKLGLDSFRSRGWKNGFRCFYRVVACCPANVKSYYLMFEQSLRAAGGAVKLGLVRNRTRRVTVKSNLERNHD